MFKKSTGILERIEIEYLVTTVFLVVLGMILFLFSLPGSLEYVTSYPIPDVVKGMKNYNQVNLFKAACLIEVSGFVLGFLLYVGKYIMGIIEIMSPNPEWTEK